MKVEIEVDPNIVEKLVEAASKGNLNKVKEFIDQNSALINSKNGRGKLLTISY